MRKRRRTRRRRNRKVSARLALERHGIGKGTDAAEKKGEGPGRNRVPDGKGQEDTGFVELEDDEAR